MTLSSFITKWNGKKADTIMIEVVSKVHGKNIVLVDFSDLHLINDGLHVSKVGKYLYSKTARKYLHRLMVKTDIGLQVEHINRDTLDNRRENLRCVTQQQNLRNQKRENNKTGFTGVAVLGEKFTAQIKHNYKKYHLGVFSSVEDALIARKEAEERFGWI